MDAAGYVTSVTLREGTKKLLPLIGLGWPKVQFIL